MIKKIGIGLITLYQYTISPLLGNGKCRFNPVCSQYSKQALVERGIIYGSVLTLWRISRCNPFGSCGVDTVPRKFNHRQVKK